jgi:hypothetical protein
VRSTDSVRLSLAVVAAWIAGTLVIVTLAVIYPQ